MFSITEMNSLYEILTNEYADRLIPQIQRKATLTVLSHALEEAILINNLAPVVFTAFQHERYFKLEQARYDAINEVARAVVIYGKGLEMSPYSLENDWFVIVNDPRFKAVLASEAVKNDPDVEEPENYKPFNLVWSYDADIVDRACNLLVEHTLSQGSSAQMALNDILSQPHQLIEQAMVVQQVDKRIVAELELTNLRVLQHIVRNQQLLSNLETKQSELGQMSRERESLLIQQKKLQYELKQLYAEFSRTQQLMTENFLQRARLEQQRAQTSVLLGQLQQIVSTWENRTQSSTEVERVAGLVNQLSSLHKV